MTAAPKVRQVVGHYRVLEQIGAGGMGLVFRAHDERLQRDVALKVLPPSTLADQRARKLLRQEALSLSKLNHPNIATVFDFDSAEGTDFLVMELIEGKSLDCLLDRPLEQKDILRLAIQLTEGMQAAHERGVIHRDLKPANLRLTPDGRLKILDFGLAKLRAEAEPDTETASVMGAGAIAGTLPYMAPEQLRDAQVDCRTDIWATGVVLHEMSTGHLPFQGRTAVALTDAILHQPVSFAEKSSRAVSPELQKIITKCLEKDPAYRYQTAKELGIDLRRLSAPTVSLQTRAPIPHRRRGKQIRALAVLPLENLMADPQQDYFVEGMQEAFITELSKASALKVVSRLSTLRYRQRDKSAIQIAQELGVDALLEGAVMREGQRVRISVQLIDGMSDKNLWAQSFDRELRGILDLQSQIAQEVRQQIRAAITPAEAARLAQVRTVDPEAYQLYLRGRYFWYQRSEEGFRKALEYFYQAIEKDPAYAPAYAGLAYAYEGMSQELYAVMSPEDADPKIAVNLKKALELDESLPEAHAVLAYIKFRREWDWVGAEKEYRRALDLNPSFVATHFWYSHYLLPLGKKQESLAESQRALELDPFSLIANTHLGWHYFYLRQYDCAIEQLGKTLELDSTFALAHMFLGQSYEQKRMYPEAIAALEHANELSAGAPVYLASLGHAYANSGDGAAAHKILVLLLDLAKCRYVPSYEVAVLYAGLGEKQQAFHWLERAYGTRDSGWLVDMNVDPRLDSLHSEPRFEALLQRLKLPSS